MLRFIAAEMSFATAVLKNFLHRQLGVWITALRHAFKAITPAIHEFREGI